jgi:hypothetical protein
MDITPGKHFLDEGLTNFLGLGLAPKSTKSKHHPVQVGGSSTHTNHGRHMVGIVIEPLGQQYGVLTAHRMPAHWVTLVSSLLTQSRMKYTYTRLG